MPKDTKTLGYIKAPACESRGFVIYNKRVHHFDTPSFLCQSGRQQHEIPTHHPWKHLACIGRNRNIPPFAPNHPLLALVRHTLRAKLRKTLSMAHPSEIPGKLHPQLPRASCHPPTGKNPFHFDGLDNSNLLRHNR